MKNILLIVPTRDRNKKHYELYKSIKATTTDVDVLFGLDEDNESVYERIEDPIVSYEVNPRMRMIPTLNFLATKYAAKYKYIAFMGDDHRPRTAGWDLAFAQTIEENGRWGICYGDDLNQHAEMCTAVFLSSYIVQTLGYMVPPGLIHLYADIFWKDLGEACNFLFYKPEIIIEHMHYTVGKSQPDDLYLEVNSNEMFRKDAEAYRLYKEQPVGPSSLSQFERDIHFINDLRE